MKKTILVSILLSLMTVAYSQYIPQMSQKFFNMALYNPAVAGSKIDNQVFVQHRTQWGGFDGAPVTPIISYNGALNKVGIGAFAYSDQTQTTQNFGGGLSYAYHLGLEKFNLSLGISMSASKYQIETGALTVNDATDPMFNTGTIETQLVPSAGMGVYLYNARFYFGLSTIETIKSQMLTGNQAAIPNSRQVYLIAGYNFNIGKSISMSPNVLLTAGESLPLQADFGARAVFGGAILAGLNYRTADAMSLTTGFLFRERFFIGYTHDMIVSDMQQYNSGNREITLSVLFGHKEKHLNGLTNKNQRLKNRRSYFF